MDDSAIDRAIDETARAMTAGEPGGALRARVMERIGERPAVVRPMWIVWPTVATAAAIALAVFIGRGTLSPQRTSPAPAATTQAARVDLRARQLPAIGSMPREAAGRREAGNVRQAVHPAGDSQLAALAPPPLEVPSSLALTAMQPESIHVQQLETIAPITVAPIGEPQGEHE